MAPLHLRERTADPSLRLETDLLIFDHITYDTTKALLLHAKKRQQQSTSRGVKRRHDSDGAFGREMLKTEVDSHELEAEHARLPDELEDMLRMVDSFHQLFRAQHCTPHQDQSVVPPSLVFRLSLLRLTTLFTLRRTLNSSSPSRAALAQLRLQNQVRASQWCQNIGEGEEVFPEEVLRWYQKVPGQTSEASTTEGDGRGEDGTDVVMSTDDGSEQLDQRQASVDDREADYGEQDRENQRSRNDDESNQDTREQPHLLDLLPFFVRVTYERSKDDADWRTTPTWLKLAADFMLQAVLEEYLDNGKGGVGPLLEAFAWGTEGMPETEEIGDGREQADPDAAIPAEVSCQQNNSIFRLERDTPAQRRQSHGTSAWMKMRTEYLIKMLPPEGSSRETPDPLQPDEDNAGRTRQHLEAVRSRHPPQVFEKTMLCYLGDLTESQEEPLLSQLEAQQCGVSIDEEQLHGQDAAILENLVRG